MRASWHKHCPLCRKPFGSNMAYWQHLMKHLRDGEMVEPESRLNPGEHYGVDDLEVEAERARWTRLLFRCEGEQKVSGL